MRLLRYGDKGQEQPGLIDENGMLRSLSDIIPDISGPFLSQLDNLAPLDRAKLPLVKGSPRIGAPVGHVGKMVCVGLNYADHAAETGSKLPAEPMLFSKATTSLCGPHDDTQLPRGSSHLDWEVELVIVIGKHAKYIAEKDAPDYVAGFTMGNDFSERDFQKNRSGQFIKGKSHDTFAPIGPWLLTRDAVPEPQKLNLWCDVNGERKQDGTTADMIFPCYHIVSYVSQFMSLEPGDLIFTGTPPGVGAGMTPPQFLRDGDILTQSIEGFGEQRHIIKQVG